MRKHPPTHENLSEPPRLVCKLFGSPAAHCCLCSLVLPLLMGSPEKDAVGIQEGAKGESVAETGDLANTANQEVRNRRSALFA